MHAQFDVPSSSTKDRLLQKPRNQLSKWKEHLTPKQMDDILRIVEIFGLDFYTDELHPDYDRLMKYQQRSL